MPTPRRHAYTRYPRSILWLVPGGTLTVAGVVSEIAPFYLSKWPITNQQFEAYDPSYKRSPLSPADRDTAVGLSYGAAVDYCRWYAELARKPIRLPNELEWEYACRGGSQARYFWGDDETAADLYLWDRVNSAGRVQPADAKRGNPFGLHGLLGGVWEWTVASDRPTPDATSSGVLRGGSFRLDRREICCALRRPASADLIADDVGFRIAKSLLG